MNRPRAVFLDRDGTLMEDTHYCGDPGLVRIYPGVSQALRQIKEAGYLVLIVTNQSGIGRGLITEGQYQAVHAEFLRQIGPELIDATFYCPDVPGTPSTRRKPEPGMVLEAAAHYDVDLPHSYLIGDKTADIECARRAGVRSILVLTGYGEQQTECCPDFRANNLVEAAELILSLD
jgi:D-glycero-D-manno-heptose 1,7-bisphosphate phosphatase